MEKVLKATVRQRGNLEKIKDAGTAMNYRCETDTAVVTEKQCRKSADPNGRWEHFKFTVIKAEEQTVRHETREEVRIPCVTDKMIDTMKERRTWKSIQRNAMQCNCNTIHRVS